MEEATIDRIFEARKAKMNIRAWIKAYLAELQPPKELDKEALVFMKNASNQLEV